MTDRMKVLQSQAQNNNNNDDDDDDDDNDTRLATLKNSEFT